MKNLHMVTFSLIAIGALNWGLLGLFNFNLVNAILGTWPGLERLVYVLVGASAVYEFAIHSSYCLYCMGKKK